MGREQGLRNTLPFRKEFSEMGRLVHDQSDASGMMMLLAKDGWCERNRQVCLFPEMRGEWRSFRGKRKGK